MRSALFWVIAQLGLVGFTEASVRNYHYTLRNSPEEHSSPILLGGLTSYRVEYECVKYFSKQLFTLSET